MTNALQLNIGRAAKAMFAVALIAAPIGAMAQDDAGAAPAMQSAPSASMHAMGHHAHKGGMWHDLKQLNLSDDQKAKIKGIHEKFKAEHPDHKSTSRADFKAMNDQVMSVLTPDQQAKMRQMQAEHRMKHHMMKNKPNQMPTVSP